MANIKLLGRIFIEGDIKAVTGLHIGGAPAGLNIGGLDNPVIRDPKTRQPFIPGSSLKGKMRSLSERARGFDPDDRQQTQSIGRDVRIHVCREPAAYAECNVCQVFGIPGELDHATPTRLTVRDVFLDPESLEGAHTDFLSTEVKWEASIDRITSAAVPRQIERVPAGAVFPDFEIILSAYDLGGGGQGEFDHIETVLTAMQLLEDDSLGGLGSRGSGKIQFIEMRVAARRGAERIEYGGDEGKKLSDLIGARDEIVAWVRDTLTPR
ncbi:MAG: type III-A CRISPR-associated RAMP protein Csm3 [Gemmatimonadetes bacterium]|nr:type III-A CRISPR-associated RAMP protein Csm3 [Gemmatimonadota bacterium]